MNDKLNPDHSPDNLPEPLRRAVDAVRALRTRADAALQTPRTDRDGQIATAWVPVVGTLNEKLEGVSIALAVQIKELENSLDMVMLRNQELLERVESLRDTVMGRSTAKEQGQ